MMTHRNCYINAYNFIAHLRITARRRRAVDAADVPRERLGRAVRDHGDGRHARRAARRRTDAEIYRLIEREGVTFACMAPAVLSTILNYPEKAQARHHDEAALLSSPARRRRPRSSSGWRRELGWEFMQIYGLTETAPMITVSHARLQLPRRTTGAPRRAPASRRSARTSRCSTTTGEPVPQDGVTDRRSVRALERRAEGLLASSRRRRRAAIHDGYFHTRRPRRSGTRTRTSTSSTARRT